MGGEDTNLDKKCEASDGKCPEIMVLGMIFSAAHVEAGFGTLFPRIWST